MDFLRTALLQQHKPQQKGDVLRPLSIHELSNAFGRSEFKPKRLTLTAIGSSGIMTEEEQSIWYNL
jgi:L,D-peptidoglycan transpeptidase YkuD (ErfK/YbiS/YcfS/YnhG family)